MSGRLWIHAASKVPDSDTIKAMENFYREIYAVNGITDLKFPEHYPVSRLFSVWHATINPTNSILATGCVEVVGCVKCEELACWKEIYETAVRGLRPVQAPLPVKFLLPEPQDPLSLKPGSLVSCFDGFKAAEDKKL
ncbi:uncharacterized protein LOC117914542 [Vitis riparia]|uniref:uncharacterized protein LOC117914542 n=1 Tax=Vitis riparia TaxID=96939 RepID=UPI00155A10C4|nr:uncharacterized protein LOC117914542 [Vitis riparia]